MLNVTEPTEHSLRYRKAAVEAWTEVVLPHLKAHRPELIEAAFYGVGSSVAYGLADEHSDIDTVLILPVDEYGAREKEWIEWAYWSPEVAAFDQRAGVSLNVKVSTWQREGVSILLDGDGSWDAFYGHQHWFTSIIPIHDPCEQMRVMHDSLARLPEGLAERAAERHAGELERLRRVLDKLSLPSQDRFVGLLGYSIASQALHFLFHRENAPLPFHKWQWPLAERLGEESKAVLRELRAMLEGQMGGVYSFPAGLIDGTAKAASRELPLPIGVELAPETTERALASIQWHLDERGCYQMVRARVRGWHEAALHYMCATRCLLIKGAILLETGRIVCEEEVCPMWEQVRGRFAGLEDCLWPEPGEDVFDKTLAGIEVFRGLLRETQALPQQYLDRPLSSPPSYELACILEEL